MSSNVTRVTVNLPADLIESLKKEASKRGISVTEAIRRGLETELFLNDQESAGSKILLEKEDSSIVQLIRR